MLELWMAPVRAIIAGCVVGVSCDADGDPTSYYGKTLTYDLEDRLTSWVGGGTTKILVAYRADGLRAWSQLSTGVRTYYYYDGDNDVIETDSSGNITAANTFGPLGLVFRKVASGYGQDMKRSPSGSRGRDLCGLGVSANPRYTTTR
jgi:hypothetical protein